MSASEIQAASRNDPIIKKTINYVTNGWPSTSLDGKMKQLYHHRDSLCIVNKCMMFGESGDVRILRSNVLKQFHIGHPRVKRMKSIA